MRIIRPRKNRRDLGHVPQLFSHASCGNGVSHVPHPHLPLTTYKLQTLMFKVGIKIHAMLERMRRGGRRSRTVMPKRGENKKTLTLKDFVAQALLPVPRFGPQGPSVNQIFTASIILSNHALGPGTWLCFLICFSSPFQLPTGVEQAFRAHTRVTIPLTFNRN